MKKKMMQFAAAVLALAVLIPAAPASAAPTDISMVRVGLYYGDTALTTANLQTNTGYGSGFRYGYYDDTLTFVELGRSSAETTLITMARASTLYLSGSTYSLTKPGGSSKVLGCYHIALGSFDSFEAAAKAAAGASGGFVAWIDGTYQARVGAYETKGEAEAAQVALGLVHNTAIVGTSSYAVNVVKTGSAQILFQFDGKEGRSLAVLPDVTGAPVPRAWFKGYKFTGGFRYQRLDGGDLTVVNVLDRESYVKGVVPYEMNNSWNVEALKVQAVCARTYGQFKINSGGHRSSGFDICPTDHCQVYHGAGTDKSTYQATAATDRAVEETAGQFLWYDGALAETYYSSSHGGASESIQNVWGTALSKYPYLCGVVDPYEQLVSDRNAYSSWSRSYSKAELTRILQAQGYGVGTALRSIETVFSPTGNVMKLICTFENGRSASFQPKSLRSSNLFNLPSIHFTIGGSVTVPGGGGGSTGGSGGTTGSGLTVNDGEKLDGLEGRYTISGGGTVGAITSGDGYYAISGTGTVDKVTATGSGASQGTDQSLPPPGYGIPQSAVAPATAPSPAVSDPAPAAATTILSGSATYSGDPIVFNGAGWGHSLGMSQYGALAMAEKAGFTYDKILTFYYPGTYVSTTG